jgi:hypothetical protein
MAEIMAEPGQTYEMQVREVYQIGMYLAKQKYKYLSIGYAAFILGVIASSSVAVIEWLIRSWG